MPNLKPNKQGLLKLVCVCVCGGGGGVVQPEPPQPYMFGQKAWPFKG